jgi:hypothetical protein
MKRKLWIGAVLLPLASLLVVACGSGTPSPDVDTVALDQHRKPGPASRQECAHRALLPQRQHEHLRSQRSGGSGVHQRARGGRRLQCLEGSRVRVVEQPIGYPESLARGPDSPDFSGIHPLRIDRTPRLQSRPPREPVRFWALLGSVGRLRHIAYKLRQLAMPQHLADGMGFARMEPIVVDVAHQ